VIKDKDLYRATFSLSTLDVDYNRFRDTASVGGEWHRQVDEFNTGSVFLQYARLQYPSSPVRDADFYGAGVGWRRAYVAADAAGVPGAGAARQEKMTPHRCATICRATSTPCAAAWP